MFATRPNNGSKPIFQRVRAVVLKLKLTVFGLLCAQSIAAAQPDAFREKDVHARFDKMQALTKTGKYHDAERILDSFTLEDLKASGPHAVYICICAGTIYQGQNKHDKAIQRFRQALQLNSKGDQNVSARILYNIGICYQSTGHTRDAIDTFQDCLSGFEHRRFELSRCSWYADMLGLLANAYADGQQYKDAQTTYLQQIDVLQKSETTPHANRLITAYLNCANCSIEVGDISGAREYQKLATVLKPEGLELKSSLLCLAAAVDMELGQTIEAIEKIDEAICIDKALVAKNRSEHIEEAAKHLVQHASFLSRLGDDVKAQSEFVSIGELFKNELPSSPVFELYLNAYAVCLERCGRFEKAVSLRKKQLELSKHNGPLSFTSTQALVGLALSYLSIMNWQEGTNLLSETWRQIHDGALSYGKYSDDKTYRLFLENRLTKETRLLISAALQFRERDVQIAALNSCLLRKGMQLDHETALLRSISSSHSKSTETAGEFNELKQWLQARNDCQLRVLSHSAKEVDWTKLGKADQKVRELEASLRRRALISNCEITQYPSFDALRQRLPTGTAYLDIIKTPIFSLESNGSKRTWSKMHYVAFLVSRDAIELSDWGEADDIETTILSLQNGIKNFGSLFDKDNSCETKISDSLTESYKIAARKLFEQTIGRSLSSQSNIKTLFVSPDGAFNDVCLDTLVTDKDEWLLDVYKLAYLNNARELFIEESEIGSTAVAFIGPRPNLDLVRHKKIVESSKLQGIPLCKYFPEVVTGSKNFQPLSGATLESKQIAQTWKKLHREPFYVYSAEAAIEERFKSVRTAKIIHISTHGFISNKNSNGISEERLVDKLSCTGFILSGANLANEIAYRKSGLDDGIVTAREVSMLDLRGTQLVVLSACTTGNGIIEISEGSHSLRRAFQESGARELVVSLFPLPSTVTTTLMDSFYAGLNDLPPIDALIMAKREVRQLHKHPYFWGGFIYAGAKVGSR